MPKNHLYPNCSYTPLSTFFFFSHSQPSYEENRTNQILVEKVKIHIAHQWRKQRNVHSNILLNWRLFGVNEENMPILFCSNINSCCLMNSCVLIRAWFGGKKKTSRGKSRAWLKFLDQMVTATVILRPWVQRQLRVSQRNMDWPCLMRNVGESVGFQMYRGQGWT